MHDGSGGVDTLVSARMSVSVSICLLNVTHSSSTHCEEELQELPVVCVAHHGSIDAFTAILLLHRKCAEKSKVICYHRTSIGSGKYAFECSFPHTCIVPFSTHFCTLLHTPHMHTHTTHKHKHSLHPLQHNLINKQY